MPKFQNLTGQKFGKLTVTAGSKENGRWKWACICDCGNRKLKLVPTDQLKAGRVISCGCVHKENMRTIGERRKTHGQKGTKLYWVWSSMKGRCENINDKQYASYGGRGIRLCEEWHDFSIFHEWAVKNGYQNGLTIDRKDNDGHYEPGNCRWVSNQIQQNNKRSNIQITSDGRTMNVSQWAKFLGIEAARIYRVIYKKKSVEEFIREVMREQRG
jgi:hypothetical protein